MVYVIGRNLILHGAEKQINKQKGKRKMSERYYYLRKEGQNGKRGDMYGAVVVSMNEDGTVNRGVSICSSKDRFDKTIAVNIARGRYRKVLEKKESIPMKEYLGKKEKINFKYYGRVNAGDYGATPNEVEKRMFAPKSEKK